jgi:hypothetical protein
MYIHVQIQQKINAKTKSYQEGIWLINTIKAKVDVFLKISIKIMCNFILKRFLKKKFKE